MNEKLQYASMLEIPTNTCNITFKPIKKRRISSKKRSNSEEIKQKLLNKVNAQLDQNNLIDCVQSSENQNSSVNSIGSGVSCNSGVSLGSVGSAGLVGSVGSGDLGVTDERCQNESGKLVVQKSKKSPFIIAQLVVVCALIATIAITNILNSNSGLNNFFKSAFAPEPVEVVDERTYQDFKPIFFGNAQNPYALVNGVATMQSSGSVYSACDGVVSNVSFDGQTNLYAIDVLHCDNFSSKIEGLDLAYVSVGSKVFANIPVGYAKHSGSTTCFVGEKGSIISNFEIIDNAVVWAV